MPYLDDVQPVDPAAQPWQMALKTALRRRIDAERLRDAVQQLRRQHPTSSHSVSEVLFSLRASGAGFDDPLLFQYAKMLLRAQCTRTEDLLKLLLRQSAFSKRSQDDRKIASKSGLPTFEERMLTILVQMYISGEVKDDPRHLLALVYALTRWLRATGEYEAEKQLDIDSLHTVDGLTYGVYEALGSLAIAVLGNPTFREVSKQSWWKERREEVVAVLQRFDTTVLQWMQSPLAGRLQALTTMPPFVATDADGRPVFDGHQILGAVTDLPIDRSRAGLYIWLNACLGARPLTDNMSMLSFLQARYAGDNQSLTVDLLIASFDVLTNAMLRKESRQNVKIIRSFICNKTPTLLNMVTSYMPPMAVDTCVQMAFMTIPMNPVPPISAGSNDIQEMLKRTRLDFLQACALHSLVTEPTIGSIIQGSAVALPKVTKYTREGLVAQCTNNVSRLEGLMEDLEGMQGNVAAIAGCIVDVATSLCAAKDSTTLKTVCTTLIKKVSHMDFVMQYTHPSGILLPLCTLLNEWTHDQDLVEFTPSYEEFAAILLFVLVIYSRYDLSLVDLGLASDDGFMVKLLQNIGHSTPLSEMTEEQNTHLSRWIECLYTTDEQGETGGIDDDMMRQCPPQSFYLLANTLFEQSVLACKTKTLNLKTLKGGLELLLEPLLVPSFVGGLKWVVEHSKQDHGDVDVLLHVLDKVIKASSSSQDTQAMHRAILGISAQSLTEALRKISKMLPERKEPLALIESLKPFASQQPVHHCNSQMLEQATTSHGGRFEVFLRKTVADLTAWCTGIGPNPPPTYSHLLIEDGCRILGASRALAALVAELRTQTLLGSPYDAIALDVCTALICTPSPSTEHNSLVTFGSATRDMGLSIKDVLRLTTSDTSALLAKPLGDVEALIRLARRVEAQDAPAQLAQIPLAPQMQDDVADQMMADLGLTDGSAAGQATVETNEVAELMQAADGMGLDFTAGLDQSMGMSDVSAPDAGMVQANDIFGDMMLDLSNDQTQVGTAGNQQNPDEDIFAGLGDLGDDFTFS